MKENEDFIIYNKKTTSLMFLNIKLFRDIIEKTIVMHTNDALHPFSSDKCGELVKLTEIPFDALLFDIDDIIISNDNMFVRYENKINVKNYNSHAEIVKYSGLVNGLTSVYVAYDIEPTEEEEVIE